MVLPQFFGILPYLPHPGAPFGDFNERHGPIGGRAKSQKGIRMEASTSRSRTRLIVVDFLATLFITFCIGVATALVLAACVMLMTGDAHGAAPEKPREVRAADAAQATIADLVLAHHFASRYAGVVVVGRATDYPPERAAGDATGPASRPKAEPGKARPARGGKG
jgi:hypothetical protein